MPTLFTSPFFVIFVRSVSVFSEIAFLKRLYDTSQGDGEK